MGEREQHEAGLSTAEVEELTRRGEVNHAPDDGMRSTWQIVRANLFTRINAIFAILVALVVATGSLRNALFGLAIVINSIVGIAQELRARHTLKQLSIVNTAEVTVRRDGEAKKIPTTDIVTGDIVELSSGSQIAVDGVVVRADHLDVDESLLTGESDPIDKRSDDELRSGSFVVAGSGLMRATAVGGDSYAAKLTADAGEFTLVRSELRSGIDSILKVITYLLIPAGLITIVPAAARARRLEAGRPRHGGRTDPDGARGPRAADVRRVRRRRHPPRAPSVPRQRAASDRGPRARRCRLRRQDGHPHRTRHDTRSCRTAR